MYFCEFSEILKDTYLAEDIQMAGSGFCTVLYALFYNSFHQYGFSFLYDGERQKDENEARFVTT